MMLNILSYAYLQLIFFGEVSVHIFLPLFFNQFVCFLTFEFGGRA